MKGPIVLVIALVVGVLAALLVKKQMTHVNESYLDEWGATKVCVASRDLEIGETIQAEDIVGVNIPRRIAQAHGYTVIDQARTLHESRVGKKIFKDQIISNSMLGTDRNDRKDEATKPSLRENRLIAIKVNEVTGAAGHLRPGNYVDVLHTTGEMVTSVILQNIQIRHTGRAARNTRRRGTNGNYTSVILEVPLQQAMVLTNAGSSGTLTLVKRSGSGSSIPDNQLPPVRPGQYPASAR